MIKSTKVFRGKWQGRPGVATTHHLPGGLRVLEHQWSDESVVRVTVSSGDFVKGTGVTYLNIEGVEPGQGRALAESLS